MRILILLFLFSQSILISAQPLHENAKPFILGYIDDEAAKNFTEVTGV